MKKGVLSTSLISALLFSVGIVFKKLHWPGAGIMISLGAMVGIVFLILYLINGTSLLKSGTEKANGIIAAITMIIILTGFTFKAQHWPGAQILIITSQISLLISCILMFFDAFSEADDTKQSIKGLFAFIYFILMSILGYLAIFFDGFQPALEN
jgi:hypothetical protein